MNRVTLIGRVGRDPEIRHTQGGKPIANLSIATSERWRDKNSGERKEKTEWHRVVVFSEGLAKVVEQYVGKGDQIAVEGQLQTRKWTDSSGTERYSTEVVLTGFNGTLEMLGSPNSSNGRQERSDSREEDAKESDEGADLDDEIPFD